MSAQHGDVAEGPGWELRCGRWQEALAHVTECDALITDPPYSERTHGVDPEPENGHEHDEYQPETYADDGCGWCGDANCEGGCPDNPRNPEACS